MEERGPLNNSMEDLMDREEKRVTRKKNHPWEDANPKVVKTFILRVNEQEKKKIRFVVDNTLEFRSMHEFCYKAIMAEVEKHLKKVGATNNRTNKKDIPKEERDPFSESMEDLMGKIERGELPSVADEHLAEGYSVTYRDKRWPGKLIREYPDGRKVFIAFDDDYNEVVIGKPEE